MVAKKPPPKKPAKELAKSLKTQPVVLRRKSIALPRPGVIEASESPKKLANRRKSVAALRNDVLGTCSPVDTKSIPAPSPAKKKPAAEKAKKETKLAANAAAKLNGTKDSPAKKAKPKETNESNVKKLKSIDSNGKKTKASENNARKQKLDEASAKKAQVKEATNMPNEKQKSKPIKKTDNSSTAQPSTTPNDKIKAMKKKKISGSGANNSGNKKPTPKDDKLIIKPNKELKNLDIQIGGRSSVAAAREAFDSDAHQIVKASICEIVKTKARSSSAVNGNRSPLHSISPTISSSPKPVPIKSNKSIDATIVVASDKKPKQKPTKKNATETKPPIIKKVTKKTKLEQKIETAQPPIAAKNQLKTDKKCVDRKIAKAAPKKKPAKQDKVIENCVSVNVPVMDTALTTITTKTDEDIEIKTHVDESNLLIDTITETIDEVVKRCQDDSKEKLGTSSAASSSTAPPSKSRERTDKVTTAKKSAKKLAESTVQNAKDAKSIKKEQTGEKKATIKQPLTKDAKSVKSMPTKTKLMTNNKQLDDTSEQADTKTDEKIPVTLADDKSVIAQPLLDIPMEVDLKAVKTDASAGANGPIGNSKKPTTAKKNANAGRTNAKAVKKLLTKTKAVTKGSKIIKIDLKAKKRIKSQAALLKSAKSAFKNSSGAMRANVGLAKAAMKSNVPLKVNKPLATSADEKPSLNESSDDDNMSLTELKAYLAQNELKQTNKSTNVDKSAITVTKPEQKPAKQSTKLTKDNGKPNDACNGKVKLTKKNSNKIDAMDKAKKLPNKEKADERKMEKKLAVDNSNSSDTDGEKNVSNVDEESRAASEFKATKSVDDVVESIKETTLIKESKASARNAKEIADPKNNAGRTDKTETQIEAKPSQSVNDNGKKSTKEKKTAGKSDGKAPATKIQKAGMKNRHMKLFGFYSGPKKRMASLNALAKVQCLYENESRTSSEGFVKEMRAKSATESHKASETITATENMVDDGSEAEETTKLNECGEAQEKKRKKESKEFKVASDLKSLKEPVEQIDSRASDEPKSSTPIKSIKSVESIERTKQQKEAKKSKESTDLKDGKKVAKSANEENVKIDDGKKLGSGEPAISERLLRNVPGLRGEGLLWEMEGSSSDESNKMNNKIQKPIKPKVKKKVSQMLTKKPKETKAKTLAKSAKTPLKVRKKKKADQNDGDNSRTGTAKSAKTKSLTEAKHNKRKIVKAKSVNPKDETVTKRIASLNASAVMSATYEVERQLDRCEQRMYRAEAEPARVDAAVEAKIEKSKDDSDAKDVRFFSTSSLHYTISTVLYSVFSLIVLDFFIIIIAVAITTFLASAMFQYILILSIFFSSFVLSQIV